jgi:hypothetical protein
LLPIHAIKLVCRRRTVTATLVSSIATALRAARWRDIRRYERRKCTTSTGSHVCQQRLDQTAKIEVGAVVSVKVGKLVTGNEGNTGNHVHPVPLREQREWDRNGIKNHLQSKTEKIIIHARLTENQKVPRIDHSIEQLIADFARRAKENIRNKFTKKE